MSCVRLYDSKFYLIALPQTLTLTVTEGGGLLGASGDLNGLLPKQILDEVTCY